MGIEFVLYIHQHNNTLQLTVKLVVIRFDCFWKSSLFCVGTKNLPFLLFSDLQFFDPHIYPWNILKSKLLRKEEKARLLNFLYYKTTIISSIKIFQIMEIGKFIFLIFYGCDHKTKFELWTKKMNSLPPYELWTTVSPSEDRTSWDGPSHLISLILPYKKWNVNVMKAFSIFDTSTKFFKSLLTDQKLKSLLWDFSFLPERQKLCKNSCICSLYEIPVVADFAFLGLVNKHQMVTPCVIWKKQSSSLMVSFFKF